MKICAFSDMHGQLDFKVEPCDLVLIGGDIVPLKIQSYTTPSEAWYKETFIPWCNSLPCEKVVFIAGNHDFFAMRHPDRIRLLLQGQDKVTYLDCETFEYKGKTIYGTPICKPFGRWAFMESYEEQDERYARHLKIIGDIDIILSHDAPFGVSDVILQKDCWWADGTHIGNESLRKFIEAAKPKMNLHGHLHTTSHDKEMLGDTAVYNISLLDENYEMKFEPQYFELDEHE
jgi:Icc-related predicted phosphoesterase